jgi:FkbM family methyltransferase
MKELARSFLNRLGYEMVRFPDPVAPKIDVLDILLKHTASQTPDFFFIQIGANNGVTNDPIREYVLKYHWRGILVEPQPDVFRELVANYAGETQLLFENVAIAPEDGVVTLLTVDHPSPSPHWHAQASLKRSHVTDNLPKGTLVKELKVPALSVSTLLSKHAISKIDLLQIDAEGFDYDIIKMFDFNKVKPTIINFEYICLNGPRRRECWKYLADWGYSLLTGQFDALAYLEDGSRNPPGR